LARGKLGDVISLNSIAHDRTSGHFYVTGKRWRTIFVGRFVEQK
jgi:glutamine cyclotransferase